MNESPVAILFADLVGYTALSEAHGDGCAAEAAARLYALTNLALSGTARVVKRIGDAVMIVARAPSDVLDTAFSLAALVASERAFPSIRVGVHYGPAVENEGDYFGNAVNLAARVAAAAAPGQVLCTEALARSLAAAPALFRSAGEFPLKNIARPVPLLEASRGGAPAPIAIDPVCRMQVEPSAALAHVVDGVSFWFCSAACLRAFDAQRPGH